MDRSWMLKDRRSKDYEEGVEIFLNSAIIHAKDLQSIRCPCTLCGNLKNQLIHEIRNHLFFNGIDQSYKIWIWHGEAATSNVYLFVGVLWLILGGVTSVEAAAVCSLALLLMNLAMKSLFCFCFCCWFDADEFVLQFSLPSNFVNRLLV
jgi:hypothetical protein